MVLVKMNAPTFWGDRKLKVGDSIEVPDDVAERWKKANLVTGGATKVKEEKPLTDEEKEAEAKANAEAEAKADEILKNIKSGGPGSTMTVAQLRSSGTRTLEKLAAKRGVDISECTNNEQRAKLIHADINK